MLTKIRKIKSIIREVDATGKTDFITRLRKRPTQFLCAFLVGGVSGLMYAPGSKTIPPKCIVVLAAYLKWYITQPTPLLLEPDECWPRCHRAIITALVEDEENEGLDQMSACAITADYIAFWNRHSSKDIPSLQLRSLREAQTMPIKISSKMLSFINCTDDETSEQSREQSPALNIENSIDSSQNPSLRLPNSETDELILNIQKLLQSTPLPPSSPKISRLCARSPTNGVNDDPEEDSVFLNLNSTFDALFGIELGSLRVVKMASN